MIEHILSSLLRVTEDQQSQMEANLLPIFKCFVHYLVGDNIESEFYDEWFDILFEKCLISEANIAPRELAEVFISTVERVETSYQLDIYA